MTNHEENKQLHDAMQKLAKKRDDASRKVVYRSLLRAKLYIPIQGDGTGSEIEVFAQDEPIQGHPVYVAFTTLKMLRVWHGEAEPFTTTDGMALFPALHIAKAGSLMINPKSNLRGELYRNEIEVLADAAPKYRAWLDGIGA